MSQTDMNVANGSGAVVRADINAHLEAIITNSSGATAPTTTFANMWWADTSANILKRRNNANTAWISVMSLTTGLIIGTNVQAYQAAQSTATWEAGVGTTESVVSPAKIASAIVALANGTTDTERANILLNSFRIAVNGGLSVQNMVDGVVDEFEDETGVDTAASTNEVYDPTGDYYTNYTTAEDGNYGGTAGTASGFGDNDINRRNIGLGFTASATGVISSVLVDVATVITAFNCHAELWTDSAGSPGSQVGTDSATVSLSSTGEKTFTFATPPSVTGSTDYWIILTDEDGGTGTVILNNIVGTASFKSGYHDTITSITDTGTPASGSDEWGVSITLKSGNDMTLISNSVTALAQPDSVFMVIWEEDIDSVTLNTDLLAYASRDGGTTWSQGTLIQDAVLGSAQVLTTTIDVSGQPAGTSVEWKLVTANTKELRAYGVAQQWS